MEPVEFHDFLRGGSSRRTAPLMIAGLRTVQRMFRAIESAKRGGHSMMMSFKKPIGMTKRSAYPTQLKWHPHLDKDRVKCQSIAGLVEPQHNNSSGFFIQSLTRMP